MILGWVWPLLAMFAPVVVGAGWLRRSWHGERRRARVAARVQARYGGTAPTQPSVAAAVTWRRCRPRPGEQDLWRWPENDYVFPVRPVRPYVVCTLRTDPLSAAALEEQRRRDLWPSYAGDLAGTW